MPFGLCGVPTTFQRIMDQIIRGMDRFASAYLEDHLAHLRAVLNKLMEVGLMIKPSKSKCQQAMAECTYLGHVVGNGVVKLVASKLQAILISPSPLSYRLMLQMSEWEQCWVKLMRRAWTTQWHILAEATTEGAKVLHYWEGVPGCQAWSRGLFSLFAGEEVYRPDGPPSTPMAYKIPGQ